MPDKTPLKRNESLKDLSRDHHHALLLCWKIRTGLKKQTDPQRIKKYTDYFYKQHLLPHFELEEKYIFPLLERDHEMIKQVMADHKRLRELFEEKDDLPVTLALIEKELEKHVRYEERILFKELQRVIPESQLHEALKSHHEAGEDDWKDKFWE